MALSLFISFGLYKPLFYNYLMKFVLVFLTSLILTIGGARVPSAEVRTFSEKETQVINSDCGFRTKRIWIICSDNRYVSSGNSLFVQTKDTVFSNESGSLSLQSSNTWKGGVFYFIDVPKSVECFRVNSLSSLGIIVYKTDWVCNISPSLVYEITSDVNANIRSRTTDVEAERHPDAKILGLLLSSYTSYDSSYENGYGAFPQLNEAWFSFYIGLLGSVEGPDLSETFIFDYTREEYENRYINDRKTRKVSVADKISELSAAYSALGSSQRMTARRDNVVSISLLCLCAIIAAGLVILASFLDKKKYGEKTD